ncbi:hypothetical protein ACFWG6_27815 [Streptomyces erythrochromogenes]|uniref:hypothetical protein n=1 Tax=Streptomyces erythrochromogenes TaxID=285574 RepID=UPI0036261577
MEDPYSSVRERSGSAENIGDRLGFVDRQVKGDLKRFKHVVEDRGPATGQWRGQV